MLSNRLAAGLAVPDFNRSGQTNLLPEDKGL
jgi:hypothetical protein